MSVLVRVICLCPSSRLSLASLVLATWRDLESCTLIDHVPTDHELTGVTAAIVMDRFVTTEIVTRLAAKVPVYVIAWNGLHEIEQYRAALAGTDVVFMGPDPVLAGPFRYQPMIDGECAFAMWRERYHHKRQFSAKGTLAYGLRWRRTRLMERRAISVGIAAAGAVGRPRALRRTLESGVVRDKLVWAGICYLEPPDRDLVFDQLAVIRDLPTADERLAAGLELMRAYRDQSATRAHQALYVTNTLVRWCALRFLTDTVPRSTWFFGRDNLGLNLELELYVHNLVPAHRIAFLELGGTKTADALYPRALHLLARQLYVISVPGDGGGDIAGLLSRVRSEVAAGPSAFFERIERRRQILYRKMPKGLSLTEAHARVWSDFTSAA